ncbi:hypothetical protein TNCV_1077781 [Trichonephila clavipes]|uniref:Uncharacterized protein n=1 Tax=Trichonephila clavipes TaxID=2585209 RepID=A0A8X6RYR5_TRICX|nr:hypothetical protein TNCV_1077781 [Trichonephila clavipes]
MIQVIPMSLTPGLLLEGRQDNGMGISQHVLERFHKVVEEEYNSLYSMSAITLIASDATREWDNVYPLSSALYFETKLLWTWAEGERRDFVVRRPRGGHSWTPSFHLRGRRCEPVLNLILPRAPKPNKQSRDLLHAVKSYDMAPVCIMKIRRLELGCRRPAANSLPADYTIIYLLKIMLKSLIWIISSFGEAHG